MADSIVLNGDCNLQEPIDGSTLQVLTNSVPYNWRGEGAVKLYENNKQYKFSEIGYSSWTPSTTATTLKAAELLTTLEANLARYEYFIQYSFKTKFVPINDQNLVEFPIICANVFMLYGHKKPLGVPATFDGDFNGNGVTQVVSSGITDYWSNLGEHTNRWITAYGVYGTVPTQTAFSAYYDDATSLKVYSQDIKARCVATIFSTTSAANVDTTNSYIFTNTEVWRVKKGSMIRQALEIVENYETQG